MLQFLARGLPACPERTDCNIGASTSQCESLDDALIFLVFIGLPGLLVALGLLLIFAAKSRDRR